VAVVHTTAFQISVSHSRNVWVEQRAVTVDGEAGRVHGIGACVCGCGC